MNAAGQFPMQQIHCYNMLLLVGYSDYSIEEFPIIGFYLYHVTSAGQSSNWTTSGILSNIY